MNWTTLGKGLRDGQKEVSIDTVKKASYQYNMNQPLPAIRQKEVLF